MQKVTYTQFRAELANFLESMRNGESFIVTQKGKPDLIIQKTSNETNKRALNTNEIKKEISSLIKNANTSHISPEIVCGIKEMLNKLVGYLDSEETKKVSQKLIDSAEIVKNNSESFEKALLLTQKKYAHIIKALEDK